MGKNKMCRDELTQQKHKMKRTKTIFKLGVPSWLVTVIGVVLVTGALISLLWTNYFIEVSGDIDVNGGTQETVALFYDGTQLNGDSLTVSVMDYAELNPNDAFTAVHTFDNAGSKAYEVTVDLSGMPLEYVDENDLWYGLTIKVFEHGTTTPLSSFQVLPLSDYEFDIFYSVDALFEEPLIDFPFSMTLDIEIVNMPPVANDDTATAPGHSTAMAVDVLANDNDPEGMPLTITSATKISGPMESSITFDDGFIYVTTGGYGGTLVVTYTISDGELTDTATLTVTCS